MVYDRLLHISTGMIKYVTFLIYLSVKFMFVKNLGCFKNLGSWGFVLECMPGAPVLMVTYHW